MRDFLVGVLRWKLRKLAQWTVARFRPGIVGITGSVGKTSAKIAIVAALGGDRKVRASGGNLNNDLGLPLTILGNWKQKQLRLVSRGQPPGTARVRKAWFWFKVVTLSCLRLAFLPKSKYPEILILEYGADRPGDIKYLLNIARPNVSVITAIGEVPVHVEFFSGPEEVAREKARLIEYLPVGATAILNCDDGTVMDLRERTRANVVTFGLDKSADVRIVRFENKEYNGEPAGISFKLEYGGSSVPVRLDGVFGRSHAYAAAAAAAVALGFGMNLLRISEKLKTYKPARGRMQLLRGVKETLVIDDSYNASPASMRVALETIKSLSAKRKIVVLGDMLEIGRYAMEAHGEIGKLAARSAEVLITVGPRARFAADAARSAGMNRKRVLSFDAAADAKLAVQNLLRVGDLVLVKGSRAMNLNIVVDEIKLPKEEDIIRQRDD